MSDLTARRSHAHSAAASDGSDRPAAPGAAHAFSSEPQQPAWWPSGLPISQKASLALLAALLLLGFGVASWPSLGSPARRSSGDGERYHGAAPSSSQQHPAQHNRMAYCVRLLHRVPQHEQDLLRDQLQRAQVGAALGDQAGRPGSGS